MKKFNEYVKLLEEAFVQKPDIPKEFAMSVYKIMHNQATYHDWENMDRFPIDKSMEWIKSILIDNGVPPQELKGELDWWSKNLHKPEHN
jgi:hypothetical protein